MRSFASELCLRWYRQLLLVVLVACCANAGLIAQNITLRTPHVVRGSKQITTVLFRTTDLVTIRWEEKIEGLTLKIGKIPGIYGLKSIRMRGDQESSFNPDVVGLSVGVYYGILTDAVSDTFTEIQIEASIDSAIKYSTEFLFVIESEVAPRIIAPRGTIADRVPTFEWEAIPGVVAYAIIISSTPFTIRSGPGGIPVVEGINPVWLHLTTSTSALYGEQPEANPLIQFAPSPLVPGKMYSYTVLNAYSKTDPGLLSLVIGSIVSFTLENRGSLAEARLDFPTRGERIFGDATVEFSWDPVGDALSYDVSVFERIRDDGSTADVQVFSANTPNDFISVPAREVFRNGEFRWFVIANDREGAGSVSEFGSFFYETEMGDFTFKTTSSTDGSDVLGVSVRALSTDGGYNPPNAWINIKSVTFSDSLSTGSFEFTASKNGFADLTLPVEIRADIRAQIDFRLKPLPSRISGQVLDGDAVPVNNATVSFENILTNAKFETSTNAEGIFTRDLTTGTFRIRAFKPGFRASTPISVSVAEDQHLTLPVPLVIVNDHVSLSGRVINQDGIPVVLTLVRARKGVEEHSIVTNGDGLWSLALSQGVWTLTASKEGFLAPLPRELTLLAGDALTNIDFVLVQQASRVEGVVRGIRVLSDGRIGSSPIGNAEIVAYPLSGPGVSVQSDSRGRYVLDLGTGFYSIFSRADGFKPSTLIDLIIRPNETFHDVDFALEELTSTVFGRVIDSKGAGIKGVRVESSEGLSTISEAGGGFQLEVPSVAQNIIALKPGFQPSEVLRIAPGVQTQVAGIVLKLLPNAGSLSGTVRTNSGTLAGVIVRAVSGLDHYESTTDAFGDYQLQLPGGQWVLDAISPRYRLPVSMQISVRAGQTSEQLDIWMQPDFVRLDGFVTDGQRGKSGVKIVAEDVGMSLGLESPLTTISSVDGSYAALLKASTRFDFIVEEKGFQRFTHSFTTDVPGLRSNLDIQLTPSEAIVSGLIQDVEGAPISGAEVLAKVGAATLVSTRSETDGSFQLNLEPGVYDIQVSAVGFSSTQIVLQVSAGQRVEDVLISLEVTRSSLTAKVIDPRDGSALKNASVFASGPVQRSGFTNEFGEVTLSGLAAGSYEVMVSAEGFISVSRSIIIDASVTSRQTFILVPATGRITGLVRSQSGTAVPGATVRLRGEKIDRSIEADVQGRYAFEHLGAGGYSINAQKAGFSLAQSVSASVSFSNNDVEAQEIVLTEASGVIEGSVQDQNTSGLLTGVVIIAIGPMGTLSVRTDSDGHFKFEKLETGMWTLTAFLNGYRHREESVQAVSGQSTGILLRMKRNQVVLTGRIRSLTGEALPFDIAVEIVTSREIHRAFSRADGRFVVENLPADEMVVLKTRMQREAYLDSEQSVLIPESATQHNIGDILITVLSAEIDGSVGVEGATIKVSQTNDATVSVVTSSSSGLFRVPFLAPGTYDVEPIKLGYHFSPLRRTIIVGDSEIGNASFVVTSSVGLVDISVVTRSGSAAIDIPVRITSLDRSVDLTLRTDANGLILPQELPLGLKYRVEPSFEGHIFEPVFRELDLIVQSGASLSFTILKINSFISGTVLDDQGNGIDGASIIASLSATKQFVAASVNGQFQLGPLPPGTYNLTARKSGFIFSSAQVEVGENEQITGIELVLVRQSVDIRGRVLRAGLPVYGLGIALSGPIELRSETDENGIFLFENVPVSETGQTAVEIVILREGKPAIVRNILIRSTHVGQTIEMEDIVLASAKITVEIIDGIAPLEGIELVIQGEDASLVQGVTNSEGRFESDADLDPGTYLIEIIDAIQLSPTVEARTVILQSATDEALLLLSLPFKHTQRLLLRSDEPVEVTVESVFIGALSDRSALVWYRLPGQGQVSVSMAKGDSGFSGMIPIPGEGTLSYYIEILGASGSVDYRSSTVERETIVSGRLEDTRLFPDPGGRILRVGERYDLNLQVRDGLGVDLTQDVLLRGSIEWIPLSSGLELIPKPGITELSVHLTPRQPGDHSFQVRITLQNRVNLIDVRFEARDAFVSGLRVSSETRRLPNEEGVARFSVVGQTESGENVLLGNSIFWLVEPAGAASIGQNGVLTTINRSFIGPAVVRVLDIESGSRDSTDLSIFAVLTGKEDRSLTDLGGMELFLPTKSIPFRSELSLSYPRTPQPKRFDSGLIDGTGLTAGEKTFRFSLRSDQAFVGDTLAAPATLSLAQDPSLRLYEGAKAVGHFDNTRLAWRVLPSTENDLFVRSSTATRLGDYAVVIMNQSLGIRHFEILPNPFSPEIAPLKIAYFLDSNSPPARVSIHIVNMRGELVRTILNAELQWAGQYGGRSGLTQLEWDGLTDDGKKARNGRYILRIEAKDQTGTVSQTKSVVLVK